VLRGSSARRSRAAARRTSASRRCSRDVSPRGSSASPLVGEHTSRPPASPPDGPPGPPAAVDFATLGAPVAHGHAGRDVRRFDVVHQRHRHPPRAELVNPTGPVTRLRVDYAGPARGRPPSVGCLRTCQPSHQPTWPTRLAVTTTAASTYATPAGRRELRARSRRVKGSDTTVGVLGRGCERPRNPGDAGGSLCSATRASWHGACQRERNEHREAHSAAARHAGDPRQADCPAAAGAAGRATGPGAPAGLARGAKSGRGRVRDGRQRQDDGGQRGSATVAVARRVADGRSHRQRAGPARHVPGGGAQAAAPACGRRGDGRAGGRDPACRGGRAARRGDRRCAGRLRDRRARALGESGAGVERDRVARALRAGRPARRAGQPPADPGGAARAAAGRGRRCGRWRGGPRVHAGRSCEGAAHARDGRGGLPARRANRRPVGRARRARRPCSLLSPRRCDHGLVLREPWPVRRRRGDAGRGRARAHGRRRALLHGARAAGSPSV
jgi:hypothetical protein